MKLYYVPVALMMLTTSVNAQIIQDNLFGDNIIQQQNNYASPHVVRKVIKQNRKVINNTYIYNNTETVVAPSQPQVTVINPPQPQVTVINPAPVVIQRPPVVIAQPMGIPQQVPIPPTVIISPPMVVEQPVYPYVAPVYPGTPYYGY